MSSRGLSFRLVLPVLLIALVAVLAALQYRWLGQVSEADREQMRRSIAERAHQFADDFDREVLAARSMLPIKGDVGDENAGQAQSERFAQWRAAVRFPEMVRAVYAVQRNQGTTTLYHFDPERHRFNAVEWPDSLAPVKSRLATGERAILGVTSFSDSLTDVRLRQERLSPLPSIVPEVPALVIPSAFPSASSSPVYTIIELDAGAIRERVLPALVASHTIESGGPYRVLILDQAGKPFFSSGADAGDIRADTADGSAPLFQLQSNTSTVVLSGRTAPDATAAPPRDRISGPAGPPPDRAFESLRGFVQVTRGTRERSTWTLLLQHPSGSINAAVMAARQRNLWLSFGILAILTAGVGLVLVNARRSERLAAQQMDFVATVSHELRTPVTVIRSAAQNLSAGVVPDPERVRMYGELIEAEGRGLTDMVEQVLQFAGLDAHRPAAPLVPVNVVEVTADAVAACGPQIEGAGLNLDLDLDLPAGSSNPPMVMGQPDALRRAVMNLVTNAVKYGSDGGWIGIIVRRTVARGQGVFEISVSDRGRGVESQDLPMLFEPFFRGQYAIDRQIQGSGLGLSLVRRIAEAHGGSVRVTSAPGEGATFSIVLPTAASDAEIEIADAAQADSLAS